MLSLPGRKGGENLCHQRRGPLLQDNFHHLRDVSEGFPQTGLWEGLGDAGVFCESASPLDTLPTLPRSPP